MKAHIKMLVIGLAIALLGSAAIATPSGKAKPRTWLFVVSGGTGSITHASNGEYTLRMDLPKMDQVIMFSDRPNRIVRYISAKELKQLGHTGPHNYNKIPPNAVLSAKQLRPLVVKLSSLTIKDDQTVYTFKPLKAGTKLPLGQALTKLTLTIDGLTTSGYQPMCTGSTSNNAKCHHLSVGTTLAAKIDPDSKFCSTADDFCGGPGPAIDTNS